MYCLRIVTALLALLLAEESSPVEPTKNQPEQTVQSGVPGWPQYVTWTIAAAGLVAGGLGGAILTNYITHRRNRTQKVYYRIEQQFSFTPFNAKNKGISTQIAVAFPGDVDALVYENLVVIEVDLFNGGNKDLEAFSFGVTVGGAHAIVHADPKGSDRHHKVEFANTPSGTDSLQELDCVLKPFNRRDSYSVKLFVSAAAKEESIGIDVSTGEIGVKLDRVPSGLDYLARIQEFGNAPLGKQLIMLARGAANGFVPHY